MSPVHHRSGLSSVGTLRVALLCLAFCFAAMPARAESVLPPDYFATAPVASDAQMVIDAETLSVNAATGVVTAAGRVQMFYAGYALAADRVIYNQSAGSVELVGNVAVRDPQGYVFVADRAELAEGFRTGFIRSLVFETPDGERVTADQAELTGDMRMVFTNGVYSPCGDCVDAEGRQIGWRLKAVRVERDGETDTYYFEKPSLEILGVTVARLPFFVLPGVDTNTSHFELPQFGHSDQTGYWASMPYYWALDPAYHLIVAPRLYTRQGVMASLAWHHELENGAYDIEGWLIPQLNPGAFSGETGDRTWRGALQSAGRFMPAETWTVGWSATAFTDAGFLPDYDVGDRENGYAVNDFYAVKLDADTYKNVRVRQFLDLDSDLPGHQAEQGIELPNGRYERVIRLDGDRGEVRVRASLLGIRRGADQIDTVNGFDHVTGFEGDKWHFSAEAAWTRQFATDGGMLISPYLGVRGDAANYDGASSDPAAPAAGAMYSLTPIAAVDVRYPLIGRSEGVTHFVEPIVQVVARGGAATNPGITNDDAHSFVFEDTNLFSFNRFSGFDRQETGVRAAWGLHYNAQFDGGGWIDALFGQTYQFAGVNSFMAPDPDVPGVPATGEGLDEGALSHFVVGATGSPGAGLTFGAKALIDPAPLSVTRAGVGASLETQAVDASLEYAYFAPQPTIGIVDPRHEVGAVVTVPIVDYWSVTGGLHYDIGAMSVARATAGIDYDDGYLAYGISGTAYGPTSLTAPNSQRIDVHLTLRPAGDVAGGFSFN